MLIVKQHAQYPTLLATTIAIIVAVVVYVLFLRRIDHMTEIEARRREFTTRQSIECLRCRGA